MELRQLRYFVKTAETLNFSEAARGLFVTQSTLSQQIRQLEQELGTELFQRDSHSVMLTESGEQLLPHAILTLQEAESCFSRISDLKKMLSGTLNIGITYTFAPILTETVKTFMGKYPSIKVNIFCKNMEELMGMLMKREIDFLLAFKPTEIREEVESHSIFDNFLSVIMSENHPLAGRESLTLQDIEKCSVAIPAKGMQARNAFDEAFPGELSKLNIKVELNEVNVLLDLVKSSTQLITFLSEATLYKTKGLKAIELERSNCQMVGCVHMLKKVYRKKAAEEFISMLSESDAVRERAHSWLR